MWKVLVVDDNAMNRALIIDSLDGLAECDEAINGKEAFKIFNKTFDDKTYDIYLVDIAMPEIDGVKLIKLIRELEDFNKIPEKEKLPIIVVTANQSRLKEVFELGCHDYMLKPIDPDDLVDKITKKLAEYSGE